MILTNAEMSVFYVVDNINNIGYNAILYTDKQNKKLKNKNCLYNENKYRLTSKYLLDTTDIITNSHIKTSLRKIYKGYILSDLIDAKIEINYIMLIVEQILSFVIELNNYGFFNANIKSGNIMINKYLNVKFLDIKNLIKIGSKGVPISALGYAAPEMYTDNFSIKSDIYSIGVLLWEMINHKSLSRNFFERHIDFQFLNRPSGCSKKLWSIILKATKFNSDERYHTAEEFLNDIRACKEYRRNKLSVRLDISDGTVTNLYTNESDESFMYTVSNKNDDLPEYTSILNMSKNETVMLSSDDIIKHEKAYLIRVVTNEMILIDKPVFKIGKSKESADLYLSDNTRISRHHATIITRDNRYYLIDNRSTNHTYLNDKQLEINEEVHLKKYDRIKFANEDFVFCIS